jgi:hypothetical protein
MSVNALLNTFDHLSAQLLNIQSSLNKKSLTKKKNKPKPKKQQPTLTLTHITLLFLSLPKSELYRESAWARISIVPLLQAEADRDLVRRLESLKQKEAAIMSPSRPDWSPLDLKAPVKGIGKGGVYDETQAEPVYHTQRYIPNTVFMIPDENRINSQWWRGFRMLSTNPPYHERCVLYS